MVFRYSVVGDILSPNEGRLHKGNPLKKVSKEIGRAGKKIAKETGRAGGKAWDTVVSSPEDLWKETERVAGKTYEELERSTSKVYAEGARAAKNLQDSDWYKKMAKSAMAAATDPKALATGLATGGLTFGTAGKKAWDAMSDAERAEARAKHDEAMAAQEEKRLQVTEQQAQAAQAKLVREREEEAAASAAERAQRLGTGRRGLLYQGAKGTESGLSTVLGG